MKVEEHRHDNYTSSRWVKVGEVNGTIIEVPVEELESIESEYSKLPHDKKPDTACVYLYDTLHKKLLYNEKKPIGSQVNIKI